MPSTSTLVDSIYTRRVSAGECYPPDLVKSHFIYPAVNPSLEARRIYEVTLPRHVQVNLQSNTDPGLDRLESEPKCPNCMSWWWKTKRRSGNC